MLGRPVPPDPDEAHSDRARLADHLHVGLPRHRDPDRCADGEERQHARALPGNLHGGASGFGAEESPFARLVHLVHDIIIGVAPAGLVEDRLRDLVHVGDVVAAQRRRLQQIFVFALELELEGRFRGQVQLRGAGQCHPGLDQRLLGPAGGEIEAPVLMRGRLDGRAEAGEIVVREKAVAVAHQDLPPAKPGPREARRRALPRPCKSCLHNVPVMT